MTDHLHHSRRLRLKTVPFMLQRQNRVRQNARFDRALKAITGHQEESERGTDLAGPLASFACLAVSPTRGSRKAWENLWTVETGKTWKALKEFPDRLLKMAEEIERINASLMFSPAQIANAKTVKAEIVRKRFNQLPGILGLYAAALKAHVARVPKLTATSFPPTPRGPAQWLLHLSFTVRLTTGRWRDGQVAELLNAAALALDEKREFDALTIAQARSRWKKKT